MGAFFFLTFRMKVTDLKPTDYYDYYELYLSAVPRDIDLLSAYHQGRDQVSEFLNSIPDDKWTYSYGEGKWSIAEVVQHVIDTERIFIHRCFRIARGENENISGFDQDAYIPTSSANKKGKDQLIAEYIATRDYSISILKSLTIGDLNRKGKASGHSLKAAAGAFIVLGHEIWHNHIIQERYLHK